MFYQQKVLEAVAKLTHIQNNVLEEYTIDEYTRFKSLASYVAKQE